MLSGFNTNFRHRGVLFHVQTEDSGRSNPHVITHLFHGGNIMASEKRDYGALLENTAGEALEKEIRSLMEGLHKSMLKQLSRGEHDAAILERMGPDVFDGEAAASPPVEPPAMIDEDRPILDESAHTPSVAEVPEGPAPDETPREGASALSRVFGERVVSEKPLDEVVLDYLVENARRRKRPPK